MSDYAKALHIVETLKIDASQIVEIDSLTTFRKYLSELSAKEKRVFKTFKVSPKSLKVIRFK